MPFAVNKFDWLGRGSSNSIPSSPPQRSQLEGETVFRNGFKTHLWIYGQISIWEIYFDNRSLSLIWKVQNKTEYEIKYVVCLSFLFFFFSETLNSSKNIFECIKFKLLDSYIAKSEGILSILSVLLIT